jgi:hypothetical protein
MEVPMLHRRHPMFVLPALVLLAAPARSVRADVLVVQEDGLAATTELQDAIDAAADGDVLLLREDDAGGPLADWPEEITITDKALTLAADGAPFTLQKVVVRDLAAGRTVVLRGVGADARSFQLFVVIPGHGAALVLQDCAGHVRVEDAEFSGETAASNTTFPPIDGFPAADISACASVALLRCTLAGGGGGNIVDEDFNFWVSSGAPGVSVADSRLVLWECSLAGGHGGDVDDTVGNSGAPGGPGLLNAGSALSLGGCSLTGGDGGKADFDVFGGFGGDGGDGGDGLLQLGSGAFTEARDCSFTPGPGGSTVLGTPGDPGRATDILSGSFSALLGPAGTLQGNAPVREGEIITLSASAEPGDQALLLVSPLAAYLQPAALTGVLLAAPGPGSLLLALGTAGAEPLVVQATVPDLGPGLDALVVHLQLVVSHAGGLRAGGTTISVLLDAAY